MYRVLVLKCSCIDAVIKSNRNTVDDESMDVADSLGGHNRKLLVVEAVNGRERVVHEFDDGMGLGGINLEERRAFAP